MAAYLRDLGRSAAGRSVPGRPGAVVFARLRVHLLQHAHPEPVRHGGAGGGTPGALRTAVQALRGTAQPKIASVDSPFPSPERRAFSATAATCWSTAQRRGQRHPRVRPGFHPAAGVVRPAVHDSVADRNSGSTPTISRHPRTGRIDEARLHRWVRSEGVFSTGMIGPNSCTTARFLAGVLPWIGYSGAGSSPMKRAEKTRPEAAATLAAARRCCGSIHQGDSRETPTGSR